MRKVWIGWLCVGLVSGASAQSLLRASAPQGISLSVYDTGYALCNEWRTLPLTRGETIVEIGQVPLRMNPASVSFFGSGSVSTPQLLECYKPANEGSSEARLRCRFQSTEEGPAKLRFVYGTEGVSWRAVYLLLQREGENTGRLSVRVALENRSGVDYHDARVRLVESERGEFSRAAKTADPVREGRGLRYLYGAEEPEFERLAASPGVSRSFDWPRALSLLNGATVYATLMEKDGVQVTRFLVYDGVKLDRFERNPRSDWNYGTASHPTVDSYLEITHPELSAPGATWPRGQLIAVVLRKDDTADVLGFGTVRHTEGGAVIHVQLGPARGWHGVRERLSYAEIRPFKEYEESFEIRLGNASGEDQEVRVVEHLYRWSTFEIVKSDTEYAQIAPQTIEFRPVVKQGSQQVIRYTVRYRW